MAATLLTDFIRVWTVAVFAVVGSIWIHAALVDYSKAHPSGLSAFDATKACQQIASQATSKSWSYKACMQEMQKALSPTAISYQT